MKLTALKILILATLTLLCSCATIFNSKNTHITLVGDKSTRFVIDKDTSANHIAEFLVERKKKSLTVNVLNNDTLLETSSINSNVSKTFYLNFLVMYGLIGGFIDYNKPKMFSYPQHLFFDPEKKQFVYARPNSLELPEKNKILLKIAPFNMVANFSNPSIMVGAEVKNNSSFSTNFYLGYGFEGLYQYGDNYKNYRFTIEQRKYLRNVVFNGTYVGFEIDYFNTKYRDNLEYTVDNQVSKDYDDWEYKEEIFDFNKKVTNYSAKLGYQFKMGKIYIDLISGLGLRFKKTVINNNPHYKVTFRKWRHPTIFDFHNQIGAVSGANLALGVRLGF